MTIIIVTIAHTNYIAAFDFVMNTGEWKWGIKDVEYFNWGYYNGKPEPSEGQSWSSHNEDCGLIGSETGEWFDFQCPSKAYAAVCEREADNS